MNTDRSYAVRVRQLSRHFGEKVALDEVSLEIPRGIVFGLVGLNGAGKTTLLKHLMGLLRAAPGQVEVLGGDPARAPERVLQHVGWLSEEDTLPGWMRVGDLIRFYAAFYPSWDTAYAEHLLTTFALQSRDRIKQLSKGQRARTGLIVALAHRPELLVLDEPSSGLDPIVRGDILEAIIRTIADSGRTVVFSSHLLDEVQRVSDQIALVHRGRILESGAVPELQQRFQQVTLSFIAPREDPPAVEGSYGWQRRGEYWSAVLDTDRASPQSLAVQLAADLEQTRPIGLHEWFVARVSEPG